MQPQVDGKSAGMNESTDFMLVKIVLILFIIISVYFAVRKQHKRIVNRRREE